jgi:hypothetical protein
MKRSLVVVAVVAVVAAALVGARAAWSAIFVRSTGGATAVVGGLHRDAGACYFLLDGTKTFCALNSADDNLDVHGAGSGVATGRLLYGQNGGTNAGRVRITCMTVVGNRAVIGGYITVDNLAPDHVGDAALFHVIDNGGPGNAPLDKQSGLAVYLPNEAGLPAGFPNNCGPPISTFTGYTDVQAGDVSIHGGL